MYSKNMPSVLSKHDKEFMEVIKTHEGPCYDGNERKLCLEIVVTLFNAYKYNYTDKKKKTGIGKRNPGFFIIVARHFV